LAWGNVVPAGSSRLRRFLDCHIVYRAEETSFFYSVTAYQSFAQVTLDSAGPRYCDRPPARRVETGKCRNTCLTFGILLKEEAVTTAIERKCLDFSANTVWPTNCFKTCIPLCAALCKTRKVTTMLSPRFSGSTRVELLSCTTLEHAIRFEAAMKNRVGEHQVSVGLTMAKPCLFEAASVVVAFFDERWSARDVLLES
jgi:hypothetical protein